MSALLDLQFRICPRKLQSSPSSVYRKHGEARKSQNVDLENKQSTAIELWMDRMFM